MKQDTPEPLPPSIPSLNFPSGFSLSQNFSPPHISQFLTEINPPLSGQISDETRYTWLCQALTIYPDGYGQN